MKAFPNRLEVIFEVTPKASGCNADDFMPDLMVLLFELWTGFENPLMVCCGHGGPPYNFDNLIQCGGVGFSVCEEGSKYVSWDGIHYTQLANQFVASKILSTNFSTPPLHFDFFCD